MSFSFCADQVRETTIHLAVSAPAVTAQNRETDKAPSQHLGQKEADEAPTRAVGLTVDRPYGEMQIRADGDTSSHLSESGELEENDKA